jgi:hypothetical protein
MTTSPEVFECASGLTHTYTNTADIRSRHPVYAVVTSVDMTFFLGGGGLIHI